MASATTPRLPRAAFAVARRRRHPNARRRAAVSSRPPQPERPSPRWAWQSARSRREPHPPRLPPPSVNSPNRVRRTARHPLRAGVHPGGQRLPPDRALRPHGRRRRNREALLAWRARARVARGVLRGRQERHERRRRHGGDARPRRLRERSPPRRSESRVRGGHVGRRLRSLQARHREARGGPGAIVECGHMAPWREVGARATPGLRFTCSRATTTSTGRQRGRCETRWPRRVAG